MYIYLYIVYNVQIKPNKWMFCYFSLFLFYFLKIFFWDDAQTLSWLSYANLKSIQVIILNTVDPEGNLFALTKTKANIRHDWVHRKRKHSDTGNLSLPKLLKESLGVNSALLIYTRSFLSLFCSIQLTIHLTAKFSIIQMSILFNTLQNTTAMLSSGGPKDSLERIES